MFGRGKKKKGRGGAPKRFGELPSRIDLPEPEGDFRNLFAERGMMPKPKGANGDAERTAKEPKSE